MKKIVTGLLLLAAIGTYAQEKPANEDIVVAKSEKLKTNKLLVKETPETNAKKLAEQLNLNDVQQAKVKVLYEEQDKGRDAVKAEVKKMKEEKQHDYTAINKKRKDLKEVFETKLKGILSKQQYTTWQESEKKSKAKPEIKILEPAAKQ